MMSSVHHKKKIKAISHKRKTWSLTLEEEHRLGVFGRRVLRKILGDEGICIM